MATDEYAKLFKRAWGDGDFKKLTVSQQALYQKLISQPDISLAGVLTLAVQRWAEQTAGLTFVDVGQTLAELEDARFVVVDRATQEVLIRSYIRRDLGWRSPKTMRGIAMAVDRILSPMLRSTISAELLRIDTSGLSSTVSERTGRSTRDVVEAELRQIVEDNPPIRSGNSPDTLSDTPSDTPCHTPSDRVFRLASPQIHATATANALARANATANATATPVVTSVSKPKSVTCASQPVDNSHRNRSAEAGGPDLDLEMNP